MSNRLPFLILAVGGLAGAAVSLFLPETADTDLPDTVVAAEEFGKGDSFLLVPCIEKRKRKRLKEVEMREREESGHQRV